VKFLFVLSLTKTLFCGEVRGRGRGELAVKPDLYATVILRKVFSIHEEINRSGVAAPL
jgi:hypothetical protein